MSSFKAYRIHNEDGEIQAKFEQISLDDIAEGDVVIVDDCFAVRIKTIVGLEESSEETTQD